MKQLIQKIGLLLIALFVAAPAFAADYDFEVDGIYYKVISTSELTCEVARGEQKYSGDIIIPETVTNNDSTFSIVSLGGAFTCCEYLTSIVIPNSVKTLEYNEFYDCTSLTSISIPNSITEIGICALGHCCSLKSITIPNSVQKIGSVAFVDCKSLTSIFLSESLREIGYEAFADCSALKSINIPNSVEIIRGRAFDDCISLETIQFGDNLAEIPIGCFENCKNLKSLTIPGTIKNISLTFRSTIGNWDLIYTFGGCNSLVELNIEYDESELESNYYEGDGDRGWYDYDAFTYKLCSWNYRKTWTNILEKVSIDRNLYYSMPLSSLRELTLGEHITKVQVLDIDKSSNLKIINCYATTPPRLPACSAKQYMDVKVRVPNEALEAYRQAEGWKEFWDLEGFDTTTGADEIHTATETSEIARYNLLGTPVSEDYKGIVIVRYSDGSTRKFMNK